MELRQLHYLALLAEELHFTRAAQRANVAQPALSRQIRKLEDELGVALVDRTTRRVRLTPAGAEFVERTRHALQELDAARATVEQATTLLSGRLALGMTQTPGPVDAPRLLAAFHRRHPAVDLVLREELSVTLAGLLRDDHLDLAFVSGIDARARRGLELHPLATEDLLLVVARDHVLARHKTVRMDRLRDERFVAFPEGATIREAVRRAAAAAGFEPHVAFESNEIGRTRSLVAEGLGVAVLPRSDALRPGPAIATLGLRDAGLVHELSLAWRARRRLSPAAAEFRRAATASS